MKDILTQKEFDEMSYEDAMNVIANTHEYEHNDNPEKIRYIKKEVYFSDPNDLVVDQKCDLSFLEGSTINKVGFHKKAQEGGLGINYTNKNGEEKILVLGFTELGMWIYANADIKKD
jgi:hypothetical protein